MAASSMDLRLRVLRDADASMPSDELAEQYAVSRAWVDRLKQRRRETGEMAPRTQTRWRTAILHAQLPPLEALIRGKPPAPWRNGRRPWEPRRVCPRYALHRSGAGASPCDSAR